MRKPWLTALALAYMAISLAGAKAYAQQGAPATPADGATPGAMMLPPGTLIQAELSKTVDAKKAKTGDQVTAKTTNDTGNPGAVSLPRGSRLIGHIASVKTSSKDARESSLAISFDKAVLKGDKEIPLHGIVQAAAPPQRPANFASADQGGDADTGQMGAPSMGRPGGLSPNAGSSRGQGNAPGVPPNTAGEPGSVPGSVAPVDSGGRLSPRATGALGLSGVALAPGDNGQTTVFSSQKGNVRLDSGTQLVVRVTQ